MVTQGYTYFMTLARKKQIILAKRRAIFTRDLLVEADLPGFAMVTFEPGDGGWFNYEVFKQIKGKYVQAWTRNAEHDTEWTMQGREMDDLGFSDESINEYGIEILAVELLSEEELAMVLFTLTVDPTNLIWEPKRTGTILNWEWFPSCTAHNPLTIDLKALPRGEDYDSSRSDGSTCRVPDKGIDWNTGGSDPHLILPI